MTLMPLALALRSAVEMPSLFSHAAAMASTPRVIQFSTISFCRAGSGSVGPSKIKSMPRSLAARSAPFLQETKYALPLLLGIRAMVSFFVPEDVSVVLELFLLQAVNARAAQTRAWRSFIAPI